MTGFGFPLVGFLFGCGRSRYRPSALSVHRDRYWSIRIIVLLSYYSVVFALVGVLESTSWPYYFLIALVVSYLGPVIGSWMIWPLAISIWRRWFPVRDQSRMEKKCAQIAVYYYGLLPLAIVLCDLPLLYTAPIAIMLLLLPLLLAYLKALQRHGRNPKL